MLKAANIAPRASSPTSWTPKARWPSAYGEFYQKPEQQYLRFFRNLNYQRATHYVASYQRVTEFFTFRTEVFYKKYHDLMKDQFPRSTITVPAMRKAWSCSGETAKASKNRGLLDGSYSYLDTKRDYLHYPYEGIAGLRSGSIPLRSLYKHYIPSIQLNLGATYSFATGRPYYNPNRPQGGNS